jgi:CheY-like chemotaxis protein
LTRKTILLVEDDRNDEELKLRALRRSNIRNEVIVAHDGAEALELLFGENLWNTRPIYRQQWCCWI